MHTMAAPRAGTTIAGGVIAIVISSLWSLFGLLFVIAGGILSAADDNEAFGELAGFGDAIGGIAIVIGLVVLGLAAWGIVLGAKVIQRRRWARLGAIITFSIFAGLSLLGVVGAAGAQGDFDEDGSEGNPAAAVGNMLVCASVVVLLAVPATRNDFERAEAARRGGYPGGYGQPYHGQPAPYGQPGWGTPQAPPPAWPQPPPPTYPPPPTQPGPGQWGSPQGGTP